MTIDTRQANGDVVFANTPQHIYQMFKGYYVESGMDPTGGVTDMTVDIAAGVVYVAGVRVVYAGGTATITAAHATLPRKDIVSINAAGALIVTAGTPATADPAGDTGNATFMPIPPSVPTDKTLIAEVYVPAAAIGIVDANVTDWRGLADFATGEFDWGLSFRGTIDGIAGAPNFQSAELAGHGDNFFIDYWVYVAWDADGAGDPPQGEKLLCTASTDAGNITVAAFSDPLEAGDVVLMIHPAVMGDISIELGEMDDALTAADLSDLDSTSAHAKLGRIATDVVAANDAIAGLPVPGNATEANVTAVNTEIETTTLDAGGGLVGGYSRAGLLIRYTADTVLTILTAAGSYLYNVAHTIPAIIDKIGDIARPLATILGTRWDSSGDLGTDIETIIDDIAAIPAGGDATAANQGLILADTGALILSVAALPTDVSIDGDITANTTIVQTAADAATAAAGVGTPPANMALEDGIEDHVDTAITANATIVQIAADASTAAGGVGTPPANMALEDGIEDHVDTAVTANATIVQTAADAATAAAGVGAVPAGMALEASVQDVLALDGSTFDAIPAPADMATLTALGLLVVPDAAGIAAGLHGTTDGLIGDVQDVVDAIPTTAMRGTDNAALASVVGALNDAAAAGAVTDVDTAMAYIKQLVTAIQLIPTTAMRGTDNAALASVLGALADATGSGAVSDAKTAMTYLKQIVTSEIAVKAQTDLILPGSKFATKTSTSHLTSGDLFIYTGTVGIVSITGRVTTALEAATAQDCNLYVLPDALAETHICAVKDIGTTALGVGSLITITGTFADALVATTVVGCAVSQASMITCTSIDHGHIGVTFGTSGSKDGVIVWEILWIPLTPTSTLAAA